MAGIVAAGAIGAALAIGGVAYAADDPDTGDQIVRVVDQGEQNGDGTQTGDCPDKAGNEGNTESGSGENL
jgi:hypothetical protein